MARKKPIEHYPKIMEKTDLKVANQLPSYFHNLNNRVAMGQTTEKGLRETKHAKQVWYDPPTSLNTKKTSFRVDPEAPIGQFPPDKSSGPEKKKMANFEQMLEKFGYTTKDRSQKPRKRPWHVKTIHTDGESSSSEEA